LLLLLLLWEVRGQNGFNHLLLLYLLCANVLLLGLLLPLLLCGTKAV
jgi:hypothetical protein